MAGYASRGRSKWPVAHAAAMIAKPTPNAAVRRTTVGLRRRRRPGRRGMEAGSQQERVRLITFVWSGRTGDQPVIFADRSWLQ